jgi:serpin B
MPDRADFSRLVPGSGQLAISDARHSVVIHVDEAGTEAAAATAVSAMRGGMPRRFDNPFNMVFDRPFLMAIRDTRDGEVLFLAAVRNPSQCA